MFGAFFSSPEEVSSYVDIVQLLFISCPLLSLAATRATAGGPDPVLPRQFRREHQHRHAQGPAHDPEDQYHLRENVETGCSRKKKWSSSHLPHLHNGSLNGGWSNRILRAEPLVHLLLKHARLPQLLQSQVEDGGDGRVLGEDDAYIVAFLRTERLRKISVPSLIMMS